MKSFALSVARFLESDDSTLTPLPEPEPLYPKLKPSKGEASSSSSSGSSNGAGSNYDAYLSTTMPPPTAPNFDSLEGFDALEGIDQRQQERKHRAEKIKEERQKQQEQHVAVPRVATASVSVPPITTTHYVRETHIIRERQLDNPFLFVPLSSAGPQTVVHVHNNGATGNSQAPQGEKEKETKKKEKKGDEEDNGTMDRWVGGALIAGSAVATTVAISKASLRSKAINRLLEERKEFEWYAPGSAEYKFLKQFDATFGELRKSNSIAKGSALSGGASAAAVGSLYYFGTSSGVAYFSFVLLGCASLVAGAYAYFYVADDRNTECRKMHAECKRLIESLE